MELHLGYLCDITKLKLFFFASLIANTHRKFAPIVVHAAKYPKIESTLLYEINTAKISIWCALLLSNLESSLSSV